MLNQRALQKLTMSVVFAAGIGGVSIAGAEQISWLGTLQNHVLVGNEQNGYTNGIFVSRLRSASANEIGVESTLLLQPLADLIGAPRPTLAAASVNQIMITPRDLENPNPAPNDTPYAGALIFRSTNVYVHGDFADMFTLDLGVVGPASGAEKMQRAIHSVLNATRPEGWDTQRPTRALFGVEAYRAWRSPWALGNGKTNGDFVVIGGASLGNRESTVGGNLLVRYGTDLKRSFPSLARVSARTGDPFTSGEGWFVFAGLSADRIVGNKWLGEDAKNNIAEPRKSQTTPLLGLAYGWSAHSSVTFSVHSGTPMVTSTNDRQRYGSITYVWHE